MNGLGSSIRWPPMVVAPSAMASSMADWGFRIGSVDFVEQHEIGVDRSDLRGEALGGEIEHLGSHKVRRHEVRRALHAFLNEPETEVASVCAAVVFARPGTDSMRIWPPATKVVIRDSRRLVWPTSVLRESRADAVDQPTGPFRIVS